ncbi:hypothetical protein ACHAXR_007089, partial [Thalassiosira sp. AJA248-18]
MSILSKLDLHPCLRARIHQVHSPSNTNELSSLAASGKISSSSVDAPTPSPTTPSPDGFVLYLPTVSLRHEQNPAFAVACRAANLLSVPVVVLAVVVDDASHACAAHPHRFPPVNDNSNLRSSSSPSTSANASSSSSSSSVVMTSRRLAFTLQALSHACAEWSAHGAAVGIRIHCANHSTIKGARTPDHLTLATRSSLVVTDEPFVSPFSTLVHKVEEACKRAGIPCIRVDGSCTVPPVQVLKKRTQLFANSNNSKIRYDGVPAKAYQWQNKTEPMRESHLRAAMEGYFDAPELLVKMGDEDLFASVGRQQEDTLSPSSVCDLSIGQRLAHLFPSRWKPKSSNDSNGGTDSPSLPSAPDVRPFTSSELSHLYQNDRCFMGDDSPRIDAEQRNDSETHQDIKLPFYNFAMSWPGADPTVPPCRQTNGTTPAGMNRWNSFVQKGGLLRYGKERNNASLVHSVSRMSAYLNLGIVSIFRLVWEVKRAQKQQQTKCKSIGVAAATAGQKPKSNRWDKSGADKFEEEIVKFREMSYAHAFSRTDYDDVSSLPRWSITCFNEHSNRSRYSLEQLANGATEDSKWNAMQQYLVRTGELHNNVRMTWGKTAVEWVGSAHLTLSTLCYLNDRYALDGLSPPSYAGLLWCMGWTEKPS